MGERLRNREDSVDIVQSVCRELVEHQDSFEFRGESQFRSWLFTAALDDLSEDQRQVVSLIRIAGLTSTQAGEVMGREPSTVRKMLGRALMQLSKAREPRDE